MKIGTLVQYKDLSTPVRPCGHHIGHKYGMIGVVTGQTLSGTTGEVFYHVKWADPPPNLEQTSYTRYRLRVLCK